MDFLKIEGLRDVYPEPVEGTSEWYACSLGPVGCDLYESQELVAMGKPFGGIGRALIHYPDGKALFPFAPAEKRYVEHPVYWDGKLYFLVADFAEDSLRIVSLDEKSAEQEIVAELALSRVGSCYNLRLLVGPVVLIRRERDGLLEILWPEERAFPIRKRENALFRDGGRLYCSEWHEDPDYHEKILVRSWDTGTIVESFGGQMRRMPDGRIWVL